MSKRNRIVVEQFLRSLKPEKLAGALNGNPIPDSRGRPTKAADDAADASADDFLSGFSGNPLQLLSENVVYDVFIAQPEPVSRSFRGKEAVQLYLSFLPYTYEIVEEGNRTMFSDPHKVIVLGSERARVIRFKQTVHAEWSAIFEIEDGLISKIAMSVYRWTVIAAGAVASHAPPAHARNQAMAPRRIELGLGGQRRGQHLSLSVSALPPESEEEDQSAAAPAVPDASDAPRWQCQPPA